MMTFAVEQNSRLSDEELNHLFSASWPGHQSRSFQQVLQKSFAWLVIRQKGRLTGFVNIAWDGGQHGFVLDTTVHPDFRRSGMGSALLAEAIRVAREGNLQWLHVDYLPEYEAFYQKVGFRTTAAGLMRL